MKKDDFEGLQTRVLHAAEHLNRTHAVAAPIWQTTTFTSDSPDAYAENAASMHPSEFYTRYGNPTHERVEHTLSELEGGEAALVTGSGMGAITLAVMSQIKMGDHIVAQSELYAGARALMRDFAPRWGVETTFVDQTRIEDFEAAIRPNTRLIYLESPSNPLMRLTDLKAVTSLAKARGITTVIDNTFSTPVNQRPLELGVDVVIHSATKYLGGHHDLTAGVIISSQSFINEAWNLGVVFGSVLSPFEAWLLMRGLRTLGIRVERHNQNALALAQFLEQHPKVERVNYPGLESHPQHQLARQQMSGFTGVLSFELAGEREATERFISKLKLAAYTGSLGGVETLIVRPAAMWSHQLTPEQRSSTGISETLFRVSVGLEDERDLIKDFEQALKAA
ncbi:MAG TPA: aminotransferase class I/II-fold pyridoxal phosphate-dependent enzyme [Pyrinomonadaceae bacterium]|nr:aminotransferase class I/II-fold pyridoxal phosphate-dependent enzyme [Pyrinomonadaceae bacterium]